MKKDTMFFEAEYKEASERISIRTPTEAKASVEWLTDEWNKAKRRNKKKRHEKYATLARNRANAMTRKKNISDREKVRWRMFLQFTRIGQTNIVWIDI